jgi:hypothetical protein
LREGDNGWRLSNLSETRFSKGGGVFDCCGALREGRCPYLVSPMLSSETFARLAVMSLFSGLLRTSYHANPGHDRLKDRRSSCTRIIG